MIVNRLKHFFTRSNIISPSLFSKLKPSYYFNHLKISKSNFTTYNSKTIKEKEDAILKDEDLIEHFNTFQKKEDELNNNKVKSYKDLKLLYNEKQDYLEKLRIQFEDLRHLFLKKNEEIELIRSRMEKSSAQARNESLVKFSKDLLHVIDEFQRLENVNKLYNQEILTSDDKDQVFSKLLEGN